MSPHPHHINPLYLGQEFGKLPVLGPKGSTRARSVPKSRTGPWPEPIKPAHNQKLGHTHTHCPLQSAFLFWEDAASGGGGAGRVGGRRRRHLPRAAGRSALQRQGGHTRPYTACLPTLAFLLPPRMDCFDAHASIKFFGKSVQTRHTTRTFISSQ